MNWNCANDDIAAGGGGGDITDVIAGAGLTGGAASGAATLALDTGFTDARYLRLLGGTLTGALNLPVDGLVVGGVQLVAAGGLVGIGTSSPAASMHAFATGTHAVRGTTTGSGFFGVLGEYTLTSGPGIGVRGVTASAEIGTAGVVGEATDAGPGIGGNPTGVMGISRSTSGIGVLGYADNANGGVAGVFDNPVSGPLIIGRAGGGLAHVFEVQGTGAVRASSYLDFTTMKNVGLLLTCMTGQIMKWNGTDWVCDNDATGGGGPGAGDITDVIAGTGLTGGATSGAATLALDTAFTDARYLQLTGGTLTGNLTGATGVFTASTPSNGTTFLASQTGTGYGLTGNLTTDANGSAGVAGRATSAGVSTTYGVLGESASSTGRGGRFVGTSSTGLNAGVQGVTNSSQGVAGEFINAAGGNILQGRNNSVEQFRVDGAGSVFGGGFFDLTLGTRVSLRTDCANGQVMKWNSPTVNNTWQCDNDAGGGGGGSGDITGVFPGQGLTGGASTGDATLSLDTSFTDSRYLLLTGGTLTGALTGMTSAFSASNGTQVLSATQSGSGAALFGTVGTTSGAIAVRAVAGAAVGANYGVFATTAGTAAEGVHGEATSFGGPTMGVRGLSASTIGVGVRGDATDSSGSGTGVLGIAAGNFGGATGVRGQATATTSATFGVYGSTASSANNAAGVRGEATGAAGVNFGILGSNSSSSGIGVKGDASSNSGATVGVQGQVASASGIAGVFDNTASGLLVRGRSGGGLTEVFRVEGSGAVRSPSYLDFTTGKNVGLLLTCSTSQVMQWDGANWVCATVSGGGGSGDLTDVLAGTGISVTNGAGPAPTVAIDTAVVPQLNSANTFTGNQSVTGNFSVAGTGFFSGNTSGPIALVRGVQSGTAPALAGSGTSLGISGQATSASGIGVQGSATAASGIGVQGTAAGSSGIAIDGSASGSSSIGIRGSGVTTGVEGQGQTGVRGTSTSANGVIGVVSGGNNLGVAVVGTNTMGGPGSGGVTGETTNGVGVWGRSGSSGASFNIPSTISAGVYATSDRLGGFGISAHASGTDGIAVRGDSQGSGAAAEFRKGSSGDIIVGKLGSTNQFRVDTAGQVFASNYLFGGADFAESIEPAGARESYEPGDVLVISLEKKRTVTHSVEPYSRRVAGIYSTKPGLLGSTYHMGDDPRMAQEIPMAIVGIVPCKVSAENGAIEIGDLLVTSSTPAHAMKGTDFSRMLGAIVGKALQPFTPPLGPDGKPDRRATGAIEVLVTLQ